MWRVVLAVGGDVQDDLCPLGTLSEQLFSLKTPKPQCQGIQTIAHPRAPLWLQFPAGSTLVSMLQRERPVPKLQAWKLLTQVEMHSFIQFLSLL